MHTMCVATEIMPHAKFKVDKKIIKKKKKKRLAERYKDKVSNNSRLFK